MSSSSTVPVTTSDEGPVTSRGKPIRIPETPEVQRAAIVRKRGILDLCREDDPARVSTIVEHIVETSLEAASSDKDFYSVSDLILRYTLGRKSIERLPISRHLFGGSVRYSRADVLAFEARQREEIE